MANSIRKESATSSRPTVVDFEAANLDYHKYLSTKKWEWSYLRVCSMRFIMLSYACFMFSFDEISARMRKSWIRRVLSDIHSQNAKEFSLNNFSYPIFC